MLASACRWHRCPAVAVILVPLLAWGCQGETVDTARPVAHVPAQPGTGEVVGQVTRPPGTATPIITLHPHAPFEHPVTGTPVEMDQFGRAFVPSLLVVREGQVVRFRNSEADLHNVNVHDEQGVTIFNVGMPILGGTYDHRFDRAGDYAVACNVHQEMAALIVVTSTPFATVADRDGVFSFSEVPHGVYDLVVRRGSNRQVQVFELDSERIDLRPGDS